MEDEQEFFDDTDFFDGEDERVPPSNYARGWERTRTFAAGDGGVRFALPGDSAGDDLFGDEMDDPALAGAEVIEYVIGDDEGEGELLPAPRLLTPEEFAARHGLTLRRGSP